MSDPSTFRPNVKPPPVLATASTVAPIECPVEGEVKCAVALKANALLPPPTFTLTLAGPTLIASRELESPSETSERSPNRPTMLPSVVVPLYVAVTVALVASPTSIAA